MVHSGDAHPAKPLCNSNGKDGKARDGCNASKQMGFFGVMGCQIRCQVAHHQRDLPNKRHFSQRGGCFLIALVFQELVDQLLAGIDLIALLVEFLAGEKHPGLDPHQGGDKEDEFAGQLDIRVLLGVNVSQKILDNAVNGNIIDIQFIPFDKEKQEIEGALELG